MKGNKKFALVFYGILSVLVVLTIVTLNGSLNPIKASSDIFGYSFNFIKDRTETMFNLSQYDLVSSTIKCTFGLRFLGVTESGQTVRIDGTSASVSPYFINDVVDQLNNKIASMSLTEVVQCDKSPYFEVNLVKGTVSSYWTATKKDGTQVVLFSSPSSKIDVSNLAGDIGGKSVTLATWTISKSDLENKLGVSQFGDNFYSVHNIAVTNNLVFHQGGSKFDWSCCSSPPMISYKFHETVAGATVSANQDVTLNLLSPSDGKINLQTYRVVSLEGVLKGWDANQGYPTLYLYYTDPSNTTPHQALFTKQLSPSGSSNGQSTFDYRYAFATNAQTGQYTFELHQNGRVSVGTEDVFVDSIKITCPTGQFYDSVVTKACKPIVTPPSPPPQQPPVDNGTDNQSDVCTASQEQMGWSPQIIFGQKTCIPTSPDPSQWISLIMQNIWIVLFGVIAFAVVYHFISRKSGGKGLPSPTVVVE